MSLRREVRGRVREMRFEGDEALDELGGPHPMTVLLVVMCAGAVGVALRYGIGAFVTERVGHGGFPWSTLVVNVVGALAMGVVVALLDGSSSGAGHELLRPALAIGLLGGFTTFSAFAYDAVALVEEGQLARAAVYVCVTNVVGIAALFAGLAGTRALAGGG